MECGSEFVEKANDFIVFFAFGELLRNLQGTLGNTPEEPGLLGIWTRKAKAWEHVQGKVNTP